MLKQKLIQKEQGFTLVEVLIAILVATFFVAATMNALVIAAVFKLRAKQYTTATNWIKQDIETVKNKADQLQISTFGTNLTQPAQPAQNAAQTLAVSSLVNFAIGDVVQVGTDPGTYTILSTTNLTGNPTITVSSSLKSSQPIGAVVVKTAFCKAATPTTGLAEYLRNNLPTSAGTQPITINGVTYTPKPIQINGTNGVTVTYNAIANTSNNPNPITNPKIVGTSPLWLVRNAVDSPNSPNVLQLYYAVVRDLNGSPGTFPIATFYQEVIPYAALQCP